MYKNVTKRSIKSGTNAKIYIYKKDKNCIVLTFFPVALNCVGKSIFKYCPILRVTLTDQPGALAAWQVRYTSLVECIPTVADSKHSEEWDRPFKITAFAA